MYSIQSAGASPEEISLSVLTMVAGAVLGAVLLPLGDWMTHRLRGRREPSVYGAFALFFAANGIWLIGEIFVELLVRRFSLPDGIVAITVGGIFGLAALIFAIGFQQLPRNPQNEVEVGVVKAVFYLIIGNMLWIGGEVAETFTWALLPGAFRFGGVLQIIMCLLAGGCFYLAGRDCWRAWGDASVAPPEQPHRPVTEQAVTPSPADNTESHAPTAGASQAPAGHDELNE